MVKLVKFYFCVFSILRYCLCKENNNYILDNQIYNCSFHQKKKKNLYNCIPFIKVESSL